MEPLKTITKGEYRLQILQDEDEMAGNPRLPSEFDPCSRMVTFHRRYKLGVGRKDENYTLWSYDETREEMEAAMTQAGDVWVPLYLFDHSGLRIQTCDFNDRWDSGWLGWLILDAATVQKEWEGDQERAMKCLESEIKMLNQYLCGDVYGFVLERRKECATCGHIEWELVDSCWGFYGRDFDENGMLDTIGHGDDDMFLLEKGELSL